MLNQNGQAGDCADNCSLDPGHPAAADYVVRVLKHLAQNYDVDGIHLDYIRYPSPQYGYNPRSLARFHQATGRTDRPAPADAAWMQWRRDQVTKLVKRVYLELLAQKPHLIVSAATITWGEAPTTDFSTTHAYGETLQDWAGWLQRGYIDIALLMNYYDESDATFAARFTAWTQYARTHKGRRDVAIGLGAWRNTTDNTFRQLDRAAPDTLGVSLYSYALPTIDNRAAFLQRIGNERWTDAAPVPTLPWIAAPTRGHVLGQVRGGSLAADNLLVEVVGPSGVTATTTDGNGMWGLVDLLPGRYTFTVRDARTGQVYVVEGVVRAGRVTSLVLPLVQLHKHVLIPLIVK